jgi:hypothetical protein
MSSSLRTLTLATLPTDPIILCIIWRILNGQSGINVDRIVSLAGDALMESPENRNRSIKYLVRHMDRCLDNQRETRHACCVKLRHILSANLNLLCGYFFIENIDWKYTLNTVMLQICNLPDPEAKQDMRVVSN